MLEDIKRGETDINFFLEKTTKSECMKTKFKKEKF